MLTHAYILLLLHISPSTEASVTYRLQLLYFLMLVVLYAVARPLECFAQSTVRDKVTQTVLKPLFVL